MNPRDTHSCCQHIDRAADCHLPSKRKKCERRLECCAVDITRTIRSTCMVMAHIFNHQTQIRSHCQMKMDRTVMKENKFRLEVAVIVSDNEPENHKRLRKSEKSTHMGLMRSQLEQQLLSDVRVPVRRSKTQHAWRIDCRYSFRKCCFQNFHFSSQSWFHPFHFHRCNYC